jgi:hypothetical protein
MGTLRVRRHLRESPPDDLMRLLLDRPASEFESRWAVLAITPDELEAAWREHGQAIVSGWAKRSPGTRPACWWRFDSPEPRRLLGGCGAHPAGCLATFAFGLPAGLWVCGTPAPQFESQHAYLRRLNLLMPGGEGPPIREPHPSPERLHVAFWQQYSRPGHEAPRLDD